MRDTGRMMKVVGNLIARLLSEVQGVGQEFTPFDSGLHVNISGTEEEPSTSRVVDAAVPRQAS